MAVNYIGEREAFYDWLTMNHLSANAQSLWNALFTICNKQRWPLGFFKVPTMTLLSYTHCSHDALLDAREQLRKKGLIDFIKGNRRADAASYKLIYFSVTYAETEDCPEIADKEACKRACNGADKEADKAACNVAYKPADVYKQNINVYENPNINPNKTIVGAVETRAPSPTPQPTTFTTEVDATTYRENIAKIELLAKRISLPWAPIDYDRAEALMADYGIEWVIQAMIRTSSRGEKSRSWGYVEAILRSWRKKGNMDQPDGPNDKPVGKRVGAQNYNQRQYGEIDMNNWAAKMLADAQKEPAAQ